MLQAEPPEPPEPPEPEAPAGGGRRLTAITLDHAISSSSNILITILAARVLGAAAFGLFAIVFLTYVTTQGVSRSLVGEPLLVRPEEARDRPGEAIGTALVIGVLTGIVVIAGGAAAFAWERDLGSGLVVLAVCTPMLVLQDLGRFLAFATHRPGRAVALDGLWLVLLLAAVAALAVTDTATLNWFLIAWAGSGAVAGTLVLWQHRGHRIIPGLAWLRETWSFSWRYAMSYACRQGSVLLASSCLAGLLGASALGAVQGTLLLFGPQVQLQAASVAAGVTEVSRLRSSHAGIRRLVRRFTVLTTGMALANLAFVLVLPDSLGRMVLGDTWTTAETLLWPAGVQMVCLGLISGVRSALLGVRAIRTTLRIDIAATVVTAAATILGAIIWGDVVIAFWALAGGQAVVTVVWWAAYRDHLRHQGSSDAVAPALA